MNEFDRKRQNNSLIKNNDNIVSLLDLIVNKESIINEEFVVNSLETVQKFKALLNQIYKDKHLRFSNLYDHNTFLVVDNRDNLIYVLHNLIQSILGDEYHVTINQLTIPVTLMFSSKDTEEEYFLMNWDTGVLIV